MPPVKMFTEAEEFFLYEESQGWDGRFLPRLWCTYIDRWTAKKKINNIFSEWMQMFKTYLYLLKYFCSTIQMQLLHNWIIYM